MKKIKNVGAVDMRFADEETLKNISSISNTGVVLFSKRVKPFMSHISISNTGMVEEVDEEYKIEVGNIDLSKMSLESLDTPLKVMVVGILTIEDDVTPELINEKIAGIYNIGIIECPKPLIGYIKNKIVKNVGMIRELDKNRVRVQGKKDITNAWLNSLNDNTSLDVMGKITMIEDIDLELFDRKLKSIDLMGVASLRANYQELFEEKAKNKIKGKIVVIPDNCMLLSGWQEFDSISFKRFNKERIFTNSTIIIKDDVQIEDLEKGLEMIISAKRVYVPKNLIDALMTRTSESIKIIPYENKLLVNTGDRTISQLELQYTKEPYHIVNSGDLAFDDNIEPDMFVEKISVIDNMGDIEVSNKLFGLVQMRLNINTGDVENTSLVDDDEDDDNVETDVITNMGFLKL